MFAKDERTLTWSVVRSALARALPEHARVEEDVEPLFCPAEGGQDAPLQKLCFLIHDAREEILVQAFYFKSEKLTDAMIAARRKRPSLKIQMLLGGTNTQNRSTRKPESRHAGTKLTCLADLKRGGIRIWEDWEATNNHNKCFIIDREIAVTGGLNFCERAEENADNMVVIRKRSVALQFAENWERNFRDRRRRSFPTKVPR